MTGESAGTTGGRIDPDRSACVLIGVDAYTQLPKLPSVRKNLTGLRTVLTDERIWGLSEGTCTVVRNPATQPDLVRPVRTAVAPDTLIVYYAGHGLIDLEDHQLYLTLPGSVAGETETMVPFELLRRVIRDHPARRRILILDCCYSGAALERMSVEVAVASAQAAAGIAGQDGSYVLASTAADRQALAPRGEAHTAFTGELLTVLSAGVPDGPSYLTLDRIYAELRNALHQKNRPVPEHQDRNGIGSLEFVRNVRHHDHAAKPEEHPFPPRPRRWPRRVLIAATALALATTPAVAWYVGQRPAGACSSRADLLSISDQLDGVEDKGETVGGLSALARADDSHALVLADNTPGRLHRITLGSPADLDVGITETLTLRRRDGTPYTEKFDGEGLVVEKGTDTVLVSSEVGPEIHRFRLSDGTETGTLPIPKRFRTRPTGEAHSERNLESLTVTPDSRYLFAGLEAPLFDDGDDRGRRLLRIQRYQGTAGGDYEPDRQYAYQTQEGMYLVELVALGDDRLLALEREYIENSGNIIRVFEVSLKDRDVTRVPSLFDQPTDLFADKKLLFDLAKCPSGRLSSRQTQSNPLLDNVEGMALGEEGPINGEHRGRRVLYLVSDNNVRSQQVTRVYSFAVDLRN